MQHDLLMRRKQTWSQQTERWHASPHLSDGLRVTGCTTLAADISIWTPSFYDWGYCNFMQVCKLLFWKSILALKSSASSSDLTFLLKQMVWSLVPISTRAEASVDGHDQYSWQHLFSFGREDHGGSRRDEILSHHSELCDWVIICFYKTPPGLVSELRYKASGWRQCLVLYRIWSVFSHKLFSRLFGTRGTENSREKITLVPLSSGLH